MSDRITIIARKNGPLGLQWGETADVDPTEYVEFLVETGALEWVEPPADVEPEPVAEKPKPKTRRAPKAKASEGPTSTAAPVSEETPTDGGAAPENEPENDTDEE